MKPNARASDDRARRGSAAVTSRRQWLRLGGLVIAGLQPVRATHAGDLGNLPPIRSCIFIFYQGGPSHLDTWDMKPKAPAEVRGEFRPIATATPGLWACEH